MHPPRVSEHGKKSCPPRDTRGRQEPPSVTALPHRHGLRLGKPAGASLRSKTDGRAPHPGARASRPHAIPLRAARFPCDAAPGYPAGGNAMGSFEAESRPRCRSTWVAGTGEALPVLCGRDARAPGWLHPVTSSRQSRSIGLCVCLWFVFNNDRQFVPRMICPAGGGGACLKSISEISAKGQKRGIKKGARGNSRISARGRGRRGMI